MPIPLTTPLMLNFKRSLTGGAISLSPSILLRSIAVGLCHVSGPTTVGEVSGGTGVAAATGLGAAAGLAAATGGHAAAAAERACGKFARSSATAIAAAGGHAAAGVALGAPIPAGACAQAR